MNSIDPVFFKLVFIKAPPSHYIEWRTFYLTFGQRKRVSQMKAPIHVRVREGYEALALAAEQSHRKGSTDRKVLNAFYNEGLW